MPLALSPAEAGFGSNISMAKIEIEKERCKGCGLCVGVCPEEVLAIGTEINLGGYQYAAAVKAEACIGCCRCAEMCPDVAIAVWR